ncbi:hypothetical protein WMY93_031807 [Mugilogobius chulae]|uniref:Uncharacterized protein n=1 Tax=Mugilogobius chulae TaxID=88201 RepID=A0AAW0MF76_9GOBI
MTSLMRKRRGLDRKQPNRKLNIRRETFITGPSNQTSLLPEGEESEVMTPGRPDTETELPLLQTNGKLPLWFRKLQEQGGAPSAVGQSHAEPPQSESDPDPRPGPGPRRRGGSRVLSTESGESAAGGEEPTVGEEPVEGEEPEPEGEEPEPEGEEPEPEGEEPVICSSFGLFPDHSGASDRDFSVQGRVEVEGHEDLSQDSDEGNHETDGESMSSSGSGSGLGSSLGSDLGSGLSEAEERFDTDPATLQPPDPKHFLQPRLSLSTRFLSRYQDRIRNKTQSCPRILEESSIQNIKPQTNESLKSKSLSVKDVSRGKVCSDTVICVRREQFCLFSVFKLQFLFMF